MLDGTTLADYPICPVLNNELCPGSYIPNFKKHEIVCHEGEDGCQDFVDALNAAHEQRIHHKSKMEDCVKLKECSWTDPYGCQCMNWER